MVFPPDLPIWAASILFGFFGLAFGSFFNVLIYRVPLDLPIAFPASHCPLCKSPIRPWHNLPVIGWILLKGKCYDCKAPISIQYPLVELLTGLLGGAVIWLSPSTNGMVDWSIAAPLFWMTITLVPIAAVDFKHQLIPDTVHVGGAIIGFACAFLPGGMTWLDSLIGGVVAGGSLFVFAFIMGKLLKRDALGFGDVKLVATFGVIMGFGHALSALVAASFIALIVMIPWRFINKTDPDAPLAFGPFIGLMGPVMLLWGTHLQELYWNLVTKIAG